jgi:hypothetical protein
MSSALWSKLLSSYIAKFTKPIKTAIQFIPKESRRLPHHMTPIWILQTSDCPHEILLSRLRSGSVMWKALPLPSNNIKYLPSSRWKFRNWRQIIIFPLPRMQLNITCCHRGLTDRWRRPSLKGRDKKLDPSVDAGMRNTLSLQLSFVVGTEVPFKK